MLPQLSGHYNTYMSRIFPEIRRSSRSRDFWLVAVTFAAFLAAASAPSPLYAVYAQQWSFSPALLTAVFAVYAIALLATLLTAGSLSDTIGRKPVILAAIAIQVGSMVAFIVADGLAWLFIARILQGLATGLVTGAIAAALIDLQAPSRPGIGTLVNSLTPTVGLALGGLLAGALVEFGPAPLRLVYAFLLVAFMLCGIGILAIPETVTDRTRPRLHLRVAVPPALRPAFVSGLPALVAPWALGGLWLSLGPSLLLSMTASTNRLIAGLVTFLLCMSGALASFAVRRQPAHASMVLGCFALAAGVVTTGIAVALANPVVFLLGTAAGAGFGIAFLGAFRTLAALADPLSRGAVISAIYLVAYLAFSIPVLLAGVIATMIGLRPTAIGYVIALTAIAGAAIPMARRGSARVDQ
jgi:MFS family permease